MQDLVQPDVRAKRVAGMLAELERAKRREAQAMQDRARIEELAGRRNVNPKRRAKLQKKYSVAASRHAQRLAYVGQVLVQLEGLQAD